MSRITIENEPHDFSWDIDDEQRGVATWDRTPPNCEECDEPLTRDCDPDIKRLVVDHRLNGTSNVICDGCGAEYEVSE